MKKFKRIIAVLTVAMFLLSIAAPAFAATKEEAFGRLNGLGVAVGDAKGDPMYDKNFTRAEAAAIMVNLSGMKAAIDSAKGATKFKDVPASHWASGVINLAVGAGIIKGYPDGTYKPDKNVSYAEMSAMLVGVLGYTPKLKGTWPSNVIGKAAELGLLDGVNVDNYNAAAVRANVFLASDNALDIKPLKETKDGYEEDTKTLMEKKLNVTIKDEAEVTATPAYSTSLDKGKVKITYTAANHSPSYDVLDVQDSVNPDDYYGLKVITWVKDDKVFFFDVKTNSSDIIVDNLKEIRNNSGVNAYNAIDTTTVNSVYSIKLDATDKLITVVPGTTAYLKNFADLTSTNKISNGGAVKVILGSDGKAAKVLGTGFSVGIVDNVDTSNEKITLDSDSSQDGTIDLKDKKVKLFKNGKAAILADIKKGDAVDYVISGDVRLVYANDKSETVKITGILDDGVSKDDVYNQFKFKIGDKEVKANKYVWVSTNNGDSYSKSAGDKTVTASWFNNVLNKDVTVKYTKSGKVAWIVAGNASQDTDIPVVVKYIKKVATTDTKRYIYVAKFDGTNTYYELTKDSKINGYKIDEDALKQTSTYSSEDGPRVLVTGTGAAEISAGNVVKLSLNSDSTVNDIKTYGGDVQESSGTPNKFTVNKDNATFSVSGGSTLALTDNTKVIKVKTLVANAVYDNVADVNNVKSTGKYIDDVETVSLSSLKSLNTTISQPAALVKDGGNVKYIVLLNEGAYVTSGNFFGVVVGTGTNGSGNSYVSVGHDGKVEDIEGTLTGGAAKKSVITYTLGTDGKINANTAPVAVAVYSGVYTYRVDSITDRQIKLIAVDNNYSDISGVAAQYIIIDTNKSEYWDVDSNTTTPTKITANDVIGKYVQVYDVWDKDKVNASGDGVYDYIMMVKK